MKIEVTKHLVMDALLNEDVGLLRNERWIDLTPNAPLAQCNRCAVGSVLLAILDPTLSQSEAHEAICAATRNLSDANVCNAPHEPEEWENHDSILTGAARAVDLGYPLSGLSYLFEGMCRSRLARYEPLGPGDAAIIRDELVLFVDKYFPATLVIDINGGRPSVDAQVRIVEGA